MEIKFQKKKLGIETPEDLYRGIRGLNSFIFQNGERYSILGWEPFLVFKRRNCLDALGEFQEILDSYQIVKPDQKLPDFWGGAVGFLNYDFGAGLAGIKQRVKDDLKTPDLYFVFPGKIIIFDWRRKELWFIGVAKNANEADFKLKEILDRCTSTKGQGFSSPRLVCPAGPAFHAAAFSSAPAPKIRSNLTLKKYVAKIKQVKGYLERGETYQVNFSQRFKADLTQDPWGIYQKLTKINPSPYRCFLEFEDLKIISCSPERLVKVYRCTGTAKNETGEKGGGTIGAGQTPSRSFIIETRPIKGTMPRGKTIAEDKKLARQLLKSKKDQAELTMIVDLERNDLGKICEIGSVEVNENRVLEKYSHVWHTVSNIRGILRPGMKFKEVMEAIFPGGSITGCPKKRTISLIDRLEDFKRGIYTGSAGWISFDGNFDFNILIRSIAVKNKKMYFHSGGGIVIDSDPKKEYQETLDKAQALMESIT